MKKLIVLILVVGLLLLALPVAALAEDTSVTIGQTSAEVNMDAQTADASSSAAVSGTTSQSLAPVEAHVDVNPGSDSDSDGGVDESIANGAGSTTTLGEFDTEAEASLGEDTGHAAADESIEPNEFTGIEVTAPSSGFPVQTILKAEYSDSGCEGPASEAEVCLEPRSCAGSCHSIGDVEVYDKAIVFDSAESVTMASWFNGETEAWIDAWAYAEISGLSVLKADHTYTDPVYVNSEGDPTDIANLLASLNTALSWSPFRIASIVSVLEETGTDWAHARATALEAELYDASGKPISRITICSDDSRVTPTTAKGKGYEASIDPVVEKKDEPNGGPEGGPEGQPQVTQPQVTSQQGELPVTGANLALYGLLVAGLLGAGIALRREYT